MTDYRVRCFAKVEYYPYENGNPPTFEYPPGTDIATEEIAKDELETIASALSDVCVRFYGLAAPPSDLDVETAVNDVLDALSLDLEFRVRILPSESGPTGWRSSLNPRLHPMLQDDEEDYTLLAISVPTPAVGTFQVIGLYSVEVVA
jgi:hypothetical protein